MSFAWTGAITAVMSVGMGAYSLATAPGMPKNPDLAGASRAGTEAEAETLADRRRLESAAHQGISTTYTTSQPGIEKREQVQVIPKTLVPQTTKSTRQGPVVVPAHWEDGAPTWVDYNAADWAEGGKYADQTKYTKGSVQMNDVKVPGGRQVTADFTGFGDADVQGKIADENAKNLLALDKKYGSQFIEEALKQEKLADPEGTAAREKLYDLIKQQAEQHPERPVADLLESQVGDQLKAGKGLDTTSQSLLDEAIAASAKARGDNAEGTNWSDPLTTGFEGQARQDAAQQKALGWLTSGATPEDVDYRREQQTIANESNFVNGRTPQSQFASLSGAQQGPTPYQPGAPLPASNGSAGTAAQGAAINSYGIGLQNSLNQVNPWMAGLSTMLSATGAAAKAGG